MYLLDLLYCDYDIMDLHRLRCVRRRFLVIALHTTNVDESFSNLIWTFPGMMARAYCFWRKYEFQDDV